MDEGMDGWTGGQTDRECWAHGQEGESEWVQRGPEGRTMLEWSGQTDGQVMPECSSQTRPLTARASRGDGGHTFPLPHPECPWQ